MACRPPPDVGTAAEHDDVSEENFRNRSRVGKWSLQKRCICDICGMSSPPPITPEQLAALSPEVRAVVEAIIQHYERRIAELEAELARLKKSPQNSSRPPSTQHPHAKPSRTEPKSKRNAGGQPGHPKAERP